MTYLTQNHATQQAAAELLAQSDAKMRQYRSHARMLEKHRLASSFAGEPDGVSCCARCRCLALADDKYAGMLPCGHIMHTFCWSNSPACPTCDHPLEKRPDATPDHVSRYLDMRARMTVLSADDPADAIAKTIAQVPNVATVPFLAEFTENPAQDPVELATQHTKLWLDDLKDRAEQQLASLNVTKTMPRLHKPRPPPPGATLAGGRRAGEPPQQPQPQQDSVPYKPPFYYTTAAGNKLICQYTKFAGSCRGCRSKMVVGVSIVCKPMDPALGTAWNCCTCCTGLTQEEVENKGEAAPPPAKRMRPEDQMPTFG